MGEAYRGLTIRIGADTTRLSTALKAATSAISGTQRQLSALKRALRIDPGNLSAGAKQMDLLSNSAQEVYTKLARLKDAYEQVGSMKLVSGDAMRDLIGDSSVTTVEQLARSVGDAEYAAKELHARFDSVNEELARTYNAVERVSGVKLDDDHITSEKNIKRFEELGIAAEEVTDDSVKMAKKLQDVLGKDLIPDSEVEHIAALKQSFSELQAEMSDMDKAADFGRMETDMAELQAKAHSAAEELQKLNSASSVRNGGAVTQALSGMERLQAASEQVEARLREVQSALEIDPGNVTLLAQQHELLAEKADLAARRAEALDNAISQYKAAGVDDIAEGFDRASKGTDAMKEGVLDAYNALQKAKGELTDWQDRVRTLEAEDFSNFSQGPETAQREFEKASNKVEECRANVRQLEAALEAAEDAYDSSRSVEELGELRTAAEKARTEVKQANDAIKATGRKGNTDLRSIGYGFMTTVTPFIEQLGRSAIQSGDDFDSAFRDMAKTVDGTETQFQRLRDAAARFSTTHVTSASQLLEIEAMGGQLGVGVEQLEQFAETASNLDIATDIDADTISQNMGQLANIMADMDIVAHDGVGGVNNFADALVRLGNNSPTLESAIMDISTRIASQANILGMTTPQVLAWSTALASTGQQAEAAGTALSKTMAGIDTTVAAATGNVQQFADAAGMDVDTFVAKLHEAPKDFDEFADQFGTTGTKLDNAIQKGIHGLDDYAKVAGMSAEQFASAWKSSPSDALQAFITGLKRIQDEGGSVDATLQNLGITAVRQKQGIEGLTQTTDVLRNSLQMSSDAWNGVSDQWGAAGDAVREADRKSQGFSGTLQKLKNNWQVLGDSVAQGMVPFMEALSGGAQGLAGLFEGMGTGAKSAAVGVGALAMAAGPLIVAFDSVRKAFKDLTGFSGILAAIGANPVVAGIGACAIALGILGVALYDSKRQTDDFNEAVSGMRTAFDGIDMQPGAKDLKDFGTSAGDSAMSIGELTKDIQTYNETQKATRDSAEDSVYLLGEYKKVIDDLGGKGTATAEDMAKLQWALDGINKAFGTDYTADDVLQGYRDEQGEIKNTIEAIDQLIQKRQEEATVGAAQSMYSEAIKEQEKLRKNYRDAQREYSEAEKARQDFLSANGYGASNMVDYLELDRAVADASEKLDTAKTAYEGVNESAREASDYMANVSAAFTDAGRGITDFINGTDGWKDTLDGLGFSVEEIAGACASAGVSTDQLSALGTDNFRKLAANAGGSTETLIGFLTELNQLQISDKVVRVNDDGSIEDTDGKVWNLKDNLVTFDGKTYSFTIDDNGTPQIVKADADAVAASVNGVPDEKTTTFTDNGTAEDVEGAAAGVAGVVGSVPDSAQTNITDNGSGAATAQAASGATKAISDVPDYAPTNITDNGTGGKLITTADNAAASVNAIPSNKDTTISVTDKASGTLRSVLGLLGGITSRSATITTTHRDVYTSVRDPGHAAGGIVKHAGGGAVYTRATMISARDMIGEAGAEYYDGTHIVPLTNRKYSQPFVNQIAGAVANAMGGRSQDTYYVTNMNGSAFNDLDMMNTTVYDFLVDLQRRAAMNRG